jgi:hypothetical protein
MTPGGPCVSVEFGDLRAEMTERYAPVSETGLGCDVSAPPWGIFGAGCARDFGGALRRDVWLAEFMAGRPGWTLFRMWRVAHLPGLLRPGFRFRPYGPALGGQFTTAGSHGPV